MRDFDFDDYLFLLLLALDPSGASGGAGTVYPWEKEGNHELVLCSA